CYFFFQAEDGIRDRNVTGVQTCALPILATIDRSTWKLPAVFSVMAEAGQVPQADLERTLNLGVGMVAVVASDASEKALTWLNAHGVKSWQIDEVGSLDDDAATAGHDFVQGAKGGDGDGVLLHGAYAQQSISSKHPTALH